MSDDSLYWADLGPPFDPANPRNPNEEAFTLVRVVEPNEIDYKALIEEIDGPSRGGR